MIKIATQEALHLTDKDIEELRENGSWDFPFEELDYLCEEHPGETFVIVNIDGEQRLLEVPDKVEKPIDSSILDVLQCL